MFPTAKYFTANDFEPPRLTPQARSIQHEVRFTALKCLRTRDDTLFSSEAFRVVTCVCVCDYRQCLDWWMDLLTTYTQDTQVQIITASPLYLHNSQITTAPAKLSPACCVFTSRSLATASNSGDSSASRSQVLS
jgi:hypothetical protein